MSEVGIIGQTYEDRRTKRIGKLLERDEKYKTLMLESPDGKTFSVSFSGFKSNWRTFEIAPSMEEVEVPEELSQEEVDTAPVEILNKEPKTNKLSTQSEFKYPIENFSEMFEKFARSFNTDSINVVYYIKKNIAILKFNRSKVIDFYARNRGYFWIMLPEVIYTSTKWTVELSEVVNTPKNRREISCRIALDDMPEALENMRDAIIQLICDSSIKEED